MNRETCNKSSSHCEHGRQHFQQNLRIQVPSDCAAFWISNNLIIGPCIVFLRSIVLTKFHLFDLEPDQGFEAHAHEHNVRGHRCYSRSTEVERNE